MIFNREFFNKPIEWFLINNLCTYVGNDHDYETIDATAFKFNRVSLSNNKFECWLYDSSHRKVTGSNTLAVAVDPDKGVFLFQCTVFDKHFFCDRAASYSIAYGAMMSPKITKVFGISSSKYVVSSDDPYVLKRMIKFRVSESEKTPEVKQELRNIRSRWNEFLKS